MYKLNMYKLNMYKQGTFTVLFAAAVIALPAFIGGVANAQEEFETIEEVVVTGSRIRNPNIAGTTPVTQIDAEELRLAGTVRVEDTLRVLPQVWSEQNTGQSNGATGTATVELRNLGAERTLVLVNGRRLPAGSPIQGGVGADINQIPGALIRRVEILTGGSSAIYGSDAVAGVVNFLLEDDFEGIQFDYQTSAYQHSNGNSRLQSVVREAGYPVADGTETDGETDTLSLIIGGNFGDGRGNATAYVTWREIGEVTQAARDYSSCALNAAGDGCFGSSTIAEGAVRDFGGLQSYVNNVMLLRDPSRAGMVNDDGEPDEGYRPLDLDGDNDPDTGHAN